MYVVVTYDANPDEQQRLRRVLSKQLDRVQNSVFAGRLRRIETDTLCKALEGAVEEASVQVWVFSHEPEIRLIGSQPDRESRFV